MPFIRIGTSLPSLGGAFLETPDYNGFSPAVELAEPRDDFASAIQDEASTLAAKIVDAAANVQFANVATPEVAGIEPVSVDRLQPPTVSSDLNSIVFPQVPADPSIGSLPSVNYPPVPDADITIPSLDFDAAPSPFTDDAPAAPNNLIDPVNPDVPTITLPDPPAVTSVELPSIPTLNLPTFVDNLADPPSAPDTSFSWSEARYSSDLLTSIKAVLATWVSGANTGIDPAVEEAIWARARERDASQYQDAFDQVANNMASRGHAILPGEAAMLAQKVALDARRSSGEVVREQAIKQADLEQNNRQFAINQSWQVESGLIGYENQINQRAFEAARYVVEAAIAVYGAQVQQFNAQVTAFTARAQVYGEQIRAELARLEIYKAQIEGQRFNVELVGQQVEIYKARLDAVSTTVDIYRAQVEAAKSISETNRTKIESYRAQVEAYGERVRAHGLQYQAYDTQVRAETSKLEGPRVQADILSARSDAYRAQIQSVTDAANLQVRVNSEVPLEQYRARIEAFSSQNEGLRAKVQALAEQLRANIDIYDAQIRGEASIADVAIRSSEAQSRVNIQRGQLQVQTNETNVRQLIEQARLAASSAQASASIIAQLAAGAMASVSYSTNLSHSTSDSQSASYSHSNANAVSFSETKANSTSWTTSSSESKIYTFSEN